MRVAIAHDYLTQRGGAERVVLAIARAFPDAPIYTTLFEPSTTFPEFAGLDVRPSPLNRIGALRNDHRRALLALPFAANGITIDADVVIASSSGWAHGFHTSGRKLVYCYSPARWLYQRDRYLGDSPSLAKSLVLGAAGPALRAWDRRAADTATRYLAISTAVRERIEDAYHLGADVLPAPHSMEAGAPSEPVPGVGDDFYLCIARLLPYKNVDRVIAAVARRPDRRLVVVGSGPEEARLARDLPDNVVLLKHLADAQLRWLYSRARAIVAASYEDYGLTPLEGGVFGKPAVVLRWGGFLDTVLEHRTGEFFDEPDASAISDAMDRLEARTWDREAIRSRAAQFSEPSFAAALRREVARLSDDPVVVR